MATTPETTIAFVPVSLKSSIAFPEPRLLRKSRSKPRSMRAVQACPAVNVFEKRAIEILAPYSVQIRCVPIGDGKFDFHRIDSGTRIVSERLRELIHVHPPSEWRNANIPVIQIALPYFFVSDTPCYLTQMPAWASPDAASLPGMLISGRFPAHLWPRSLNLAFEWQDTRLDFQMRRGQPICYFYPETEHPESPIRLVPGKLTNALATYRARMDGVVDYTSQALELIDDIEKYRPETLVEEA
ncbi:MAG: hypothetical protein AAFW60_07670 [Pseudomonadota bacterium]